jgi:hypothetical protein
MAFGYPNCRGKSKARAFANLLGRKKGIKYSLDDFRGDTRSGIRRLSPHILRLRIGMDAGVVCSEYPCSPRGWSMCRRPAWHRAH